MVTRRPGVAQDQVRRHNLSTLLRAVHETGPVTRAQLTSGMRLNRSTIKDLVDELAMLGAVSEEAPASGGGSGARGSAGRPSLLVRPRSDRVQVIAVDIGVDRVVAACVGLGGSVVARGHSALATTDPTAVVGVVAGLVERVSQQVGPGSVVVGAGVSVPGVVRNADGCVRFAPNLGWVDEPLGDLLGTALGRSVRIANDADLGVLAEHRRGAARGYDDVVFIAGEVGVGGGVIIGGRPLVGAGGYAGELGHMRFALDGRPCRCGSTGCWETEIGAQAMARALGLGEVATEVLVTAVREASRDGSHLLDGVARNVGLGLASLVNLLNPKLVILGGLLRELLPCAGEVITETMTCAALAAPARQVRITAPQLGGDAVLLGAAELAWEALLADPVGVLSGKDASGGRDAQPGEDALSGVEHVR